MGRPDARLAGLRALFAATLFLGPAAFSLASVDADTVTSGIPLRTGSIASDASQGVSITPLQVGLSALRKGQVGLALSLRDGLQQGSLDWKVLTWAIAFSPGAGVPSGEIAEAAVMLPDWPGAAIMRRNGEKALFRENPAPEAVIAAFGDRAPQTFEGTVLLARADLATGQSEAARALLVPFWRSAKLEAAQETLVLSEFGAVLSPADHRVRMEAMLYAERIGSAKRVAGPAGAAALWEAWSAVIRGQAKAGKLLDAVPAAQRSAGFLFARTRALRRAGNFEQAAQTLLKAPKSGDALVDPDAWWNERRALSRELVDLGDIGTAYRIVADHAAESPTDAADAEFHAGWYALRGLRDPAAASRHFARIAEVASAPISKARAYYWLGRAAEAGGPGDAGTFYEHAAVFGTTFYGQLGAAKLGRHAISVVYPDPSAIDRQAFLRRDAVQAIARLEAAGATRLADTLTRDLASDLTSPGELALLAAMAEKRGNHFLALKVGKAAAARGLDVGALTHPLGAIPASADVSGAGTALAYAIARQESEFNLGAVSGAGARGLLQLLPGTAREAARKAGVPYSVARLTTDAGYNATLGAAFLGDQLGRFDGSYVLTFAGYNAGPRKAREWVARYGDPRGQDLDTVVDWIERIPYAETRSYVQRVMENYQVYKMRISGECDIGRDLVHGR